MTIAVYGATGYTAKLAVAELARQGIETVLVGRDAERLAVAAREAGAEGAEIRRAGLDDPAVLADAFRGCSVVISCVAPFRRWGEPVLRAALAAGAHYVDVSGEQTYIARLFDAYADEAERAGVAVVPGMNDGGLPGSLIAQLTADRIGPVEEIVVGHRVAEDGGLTRGSARTFLDNRELFQGGGLAYEDGRWLPAGPLPPASMTFPGESEPTEMVRGPLAEVVTVPRHVPLRRLTGLAEAGLMALFNAVTPEILQTIPEAGPTPEERRIGGFTVLAEALGVDGRRARGAVHGPNTYATTALVAAEGARRLAAEGAPAGVLAPAQAFDPAGFLDSLAPHGLRWSVEELAR
ncbi:saccharopine dehydrogenase family protein [Allostreptomyces psammosilenae]|uniref:Short subunit dehydrogenase-like uncharacterized protein n=1 Tax=Allostreptomyces psammosilenae TaxID=1892865 RepID=A0A853A1W5_9ACTN|nr:saccharopine dehydrogenase NADP-binding domain-containing protein [Allostreptomyces psammosilenae]NYI07450.1 short subunit dehydrogenase-like uncharacterized protein [Allostreptomyces psammosilenae]